MGLVIKFCQGVLLMACVPFYAPSEGGIAVTFLGNVPVGKVAVIEPEGWPPRSFEADGGFFPGAEVQFSHGHCCPKTP